MEFWIEILPNVRIRHVSNILLITAKRTEWFGECDELVTCDALYEGPYVKHIARCYSHSEWGKKQGDGSWTSFNLSTLFLECHFMH